MEQPSSFHLPPSSHRQSSANHRLLAVKSGKMASFPRFGEFPHEIQVKIWNHALEPGIHFFAASYHATRRSAVIRLDTRSSYYHRQNIAAVCTISREVAERFRRKAGTWTATLASRRRVKLLIDPRSDVVCISVTPPTGDYPGRVVEKFRARRSMSTVRRFAVELCKRGVPGLPNSLHIVNDSYRQRSDALLQTPQLVGSAVCIGWMARQFRRLEEVYLLHEGFPKPQTPVTPRDLIRVSVAGASADPRTAVFASATDDYYEATMPPARIDGDDTDERRSKAKQCGKLLQLGSICYYFLVSDREAQRARAANDEPTAELSPALIRAAKLEFKLLSGGQL